MWTTWLTRNIMPGLGRLTYEDMAFIGIVLEGFCYGEIFCPAVIIGMINHSYPGLYSAIFFIYMQYHILKERSIEKRTIFLYALGVLYTLSSAIIVLDVTDHVLKAVSKICIHHNNISLYTTMRVAAGGPSALPLLCVGDNSRPVRLHFSSNLSMHTFLTISIIYFLFISIFEDLPMLAYMGS